MKTFFWTSLFRILVILGGSMYFKLVDDTIIKNFFDMDVVKISESNTNGNNVMVNTGVMQKLNEIDQKITDGFDNLESNLGSTSQSVSTVSSIETNDTTTNIATSTGDSSSTATGTDENIDNVATGDNNQ